MLRKPIIGMTRDHIRDQQRSRLNVPPRRYRGKVFLTPAPLNSQNGAAEILSCYFNTYSGQVATAEPHGPGWTALPGLKSFDRNAT
jgi:hypothetical protein